MSETRRPYSSFADIVQAVSKAVSARGESAVLVGIDGAGGSGKSTLAARLAAMFDDATVVHVDDFADWNDDSNWELSNFSERVLEPLLAGVVSKHQRYDWSTNSHGDWFEVLPSKIAIVEGVTALRPNLRKYWQVSVWVDCPREVRLARGIERDGEEMRSKWVDRWMPGEDRYFAHDRPREAAQLVFDGSGEPT
jgi:uridine kinase